MPMAVMLVDGTGLRQARLCWDPSPTRGGPLDEGNKVDKLLTELSL